jgi:hypothetical protein
MDSHSAAIFLIHLRCILKGWEVTMAMSNQRRFVMNRAWLLILAFGGLLVGTLTATEPEVTITPRGIEGNYYPSPAIKRISDHWCLSIYPKGDGAETLVAHLIDPVAKGDRRVTQHRFQQVQLDGTRLSISGCKIRELTIDFTGVFVASDPYHNIYPGDRVVLQGTVSIVSGNDREVFENIDFTYDSGY